MDIIKEKYHDWLKSKSISSNLRNELINMSEDEIEICFSNDISFGTGGLRAKMGPGTNRLNEITVRRCAEGYAKYLQKELTGSILIVIAYDNRKNSKKFADIMISVLNSYNIITHVFDDMKPTPELSYAIRKYKANGGVVITASHNPAEYNGIKMYDNTGCQCIEKMTKKIKKYIDLVNIKDLLECDLNIGKVEKNDILRYIGIDFDKEYLENCKNIIINKGINFSDLKVLYTPQHGTGNMPVGTALKDIGCNLFLVENQSFPSEDFVNTKCPNPEKEESFEEALKIAKNLEPDIIIGTDPDCDRIGVMTKCEDKYFLLTGNQIGLIMLNYIIEQRDFVKEESIVYNTVVSSSLANKICDENNIEIESTLTGFKNIGALINQQKKDFILGLEESNGYLISDIVRDKDGVQSSIMICEIAAWCKENNLNLLDYLSRIYEKYGYFIDAQDTIDLTENDNTDFIMNKIRTKISSMLKSDIYKVEDFLKSEIIYTDRTEKLNYSKTNLIKIYFSKYSWIAVRPSGTEPKLKIYYCLDDEKNLNRERIKKNLFEFLK